MVNCGEHVVKEMVAKGCVDQGLGHGSELLLGLVHVPGGVEHVEPPVTIMSQLVSSMIQLWSVVSGRLLYDQHVSSHAVQGDEQPPARVHVLEEKYFNSWLNHVLFVPELLLQE